MKLTDPQLSRLCRAVSLVIRFHGDNCMGVFDRGGVCKRLEAMGLMAFQGFGVDIDGDGEDERPVYNATELGMSELLHRGEFTLEDAEAWRKATARLNEIFAERPPPAPL